MKPGRGEPPTNPESAPPAGDSAPARTLSTPPPSTPGSLRPAGLPERDPGRYEITREAGRGGIGRVLEAQDLELGRRVAIKELLQSPQGDAEARFLREARVTARLEHPSVVPVHDAGSWKGSGRPFYAMKLVSGRSLQVLAQEAKDLSARLALLPNVLAVAEAIAYAHSQRVVHRDLKPANVVVGEYGETIVIDWGLAKDLRERDSDATLPDHPGPPSAGSGGLTEQGAIMGTPWFMPPEQARGEEVDARADVFALGAILYFVLSGALPYPGNDGASVLRAVLAGAPRSLRSHEPRVPADLAAIVDKAMARSPDDRYRDAGALAADLKRFLTGQLVGAHAYSSLQLAARWLRRHRGAAAFLALLVAGSAAYVARVTHLRNIAESARADSEAQTLKLLEQSGRVELDAGAPSRAAVYLAEAIRRDPEKVALRMLVKEAGSALETHLFALEGHTRDVVCAAWSSDGARIVTGSADLTVRVWDGATGREIRTLRGHERWLEDVTFSPDGRFIGSVGAGDASIVWDAATGAIVHRFPVGGFRVAFSPDSKVFLMGGKRGELFVWDVASGKAIVESKTAFRDRLAALEFHPREPFLVIASWDGTLAWWDTRTWKQTRTLAEDAEGVQTADISDDGRWLVSGDFSGRVNVRDARSGELFHLFDVPPGARSMTAWFGPEARTIVTASHDGMFRVWHAGSGTLLRSVDAVPRGKMFDGALSPGGEKLVTTKLRGADVWSVALGSAYRLADIEQHQAAEIHPGVMSPDGTFVAGVERRGSTEIVAWDGRTGARLRSWPDEGQAHSIAVALGGRRIVTAGTDVKPARVWDASGKRIATLDAHGGRITHDVAASDDGSMLATAGYDGRVLFYRAEDGSRTGPEIRLPPNQGSPRLSIATAIAFSPDGERIAITDENGVLRIASTRDGAIVAATPAHLTWIQDVSYSRDGARIVTTGRQDHTVKIWDAASLTLLHELAGHLQNGMRASFSPDGRLVASVSRDNTARLWDSRTGDLLRTLPGPNNAAAFDAAGATLFTAGVGDYAVLWDLATDARSPEEIAAAVAKGSPWQLCAGELVADSVPCDDASP